MSIVTSLCNTNIRYERYKLLDSFMFSSSTRHRMYWWSIIFVFEFFLIITIFHYPYIIGSYNDVHVIDSLCFSYLIFTQLPSVYNVKTHDNIAIAQSKTYMALYHITVRIMIILSNWGLHGYYFIGSQINQKLIS